MNKKIILFTLVLLYIALEVLAIKICYEFYRSWDLYLGIVGMILEGTMGLLPVVARYLMKNRNRLLGSMFYFFTLLGIMFCIMSVSSTYLNGIQNDKKSKISSVENPNYSVLLQQEIDTKKTIEDIKISIKTTESDRQLQISRTDVKYYETIQGINKASNDQIAQKTQLLVTEQNKLNEIQKKILVEPKTIEKVINKKSSGNEFFLGMISKLVKLKIDTLSLICSVLLGVFLCVFNIGLCTFIEIFYHQKKVSGNEEQRKSINNLDEKSINEKVSQKKSITEKVSIILDDTKKSINETEKSVNETKKSISQNKKSINETKKSINSNEKSIKTDFINIYNITKSEVEKETGRKAKDTVIMPIVAEKLNVSITTLKRYKAEMKNNVNSEKVSSPEKKVSSENKKVSVIQKKVSDENKIVSINKNDTKKSINSKKVSSKKVSEIES
jgi:hypothetical protein